MNATGWIKMWQIPLDDGTVDVSSEVATSRKRAETAAAMVLAGLAPVAAALETKCASSCSYRDHELGWVTVLWARPTDRLEVAIIRPNEVHRYASGMWRRR